MRYAVIADVHGNLEALRAVLGRIAELGAERIVCLGDVVGYNADPNACIDIVRSEAMPCIAGNHDVCACGLAEPAVFNTDAQRAVLWTRLQLTGENRSFLRGLPRELTIDDDFFICHGSIHDTDRYVLTQQDVRDNFSMLEQTPGSPRTCFYGHTHVTTAFSRKGGIITRELADGITMAPEHQYLINPGAVGQPRDGDPRAAFLIYDTRERTVVFHRVEYDIRVCRDKVIRAGLPLRLAERLAIGL